MPLKKRVRNLALKRVKCPTCAGKGSIENPDKAGMTLRTERKKAKIKGQDMAKALKISPTNLSEKEKGKRRFTPPQIDAYRAEIARVLAIAA